MEKPEMGPEPVNKWNVSKLPRVGEQGNQDARYHGRHNAKEILVSFDDKQAAEDWVNAHPELKNGICIWQGCSGDGRGLPASAAMARVGIGGAALGTLLIAIPALILYFGHTPLPEGRRRSPLPQLQLQTPPDSLGRAGQCFERDIGAIGVEQPIQLGTARMQLAGQGALCHLLLFHRSSQLKGNHA
ncbi:MAG TPA: hypothetical protein VND64_27735, partial [Pirellulales bacterium]|nr:hypothetical protein [Pirellulales bacterium]